MTTGPSGSGRSWTEKNVMVPMRDGVRLATDIYRPDVQTPVATLLQRTPYDKNVSSFHNFTLEIGRLVESGYAVVVQDVRGRFGSEGDFEPFAAEGPDGVDTVAWIRDQEWSSGRIGMFGASYYGATQWLALGAGADVDVIAPGLASATIRQGWAYDGGAFHLGFNLNWVSSVLAPGELIRRMAGGTDALVDLESLIAFVDDDRTAYGTTPLDGDELLARTAAYYRAWLRHPESADYWAARECGDLGGAAAPALSIGGWYDIFLAGTIAGHLDASARSRGSRLVIGPWAHGNMTGQFPERSFGFGSHYQALDPTGMHLRLFDEHLRDTPSSEEAPVRVFVMGTDHWCDLAAWPPPQVEYRSYYLGRPRSGGNRDGILSEDLGTVEAGEASYRYDPADPVPTVGGATFLPGLLVGANAGPRDQAELDARQDILTFATAPLEEDLTVVGPVELVLHVSSDVSDTDFTGKLIDVDPEGRSVILTDGIVRARYRNGQDAPSLLTPGETYELRIDLVATANVFKRGHRIRVDVSSSNFPKYDRNLNTGQLNGSSRLDSAIVAENRVHLGSATPSRLVLPVAADVR